MMAGHINVDHRRADSTPEPASLEGLVREDREILTEVFAVASGRHRSAPTTTTTLAPAW